jgi:probable DNA repair protein
MDAWLREGGLVIASSDRAARALASAFHRARRAEGLTAWPAPKIHDWRSFARAAWDERSTYAATDGRLLLNSTQEQAIWADIAGAGQHMAAVLEGPRHRLAALAMEAHDLLCSFAPRLLQSEAARSGWQQDAAAFGAWLTAFEKACSAGNLLSPSRLPLALVPLLKAGPAARPPLLLAGFDRILPAQRALFDAWGQWQKAAHGEKAADVTFHAANDLQSELDACALWCHSKLAAHPEARLLVVTQDASARRGEIERAFLRHTGSSAKPLFEFSLGIPLGQAPLAKGAHLVLRWLTGPIEEQELDWLLATGQIAASLQESSALLAYMRALRSGNLERIHWTLGAFLTQKPAPAMLPAQWSQRMHLARTGLAAEIARQQSPLDWAGLVSQLLQATGWPGWRPLESAEHQALNRWEQAVDASASLGFDGRRIPWQEFLTTLGRTVTETLFAPESEDAPIQIAGPAESAGLTADAVWFLGASEEAWPAGGATHPLLPPEIQRDTSMPHATPQLDWELAHAITTRLLASAPDVHFSYPQQSDKSETRPSRLITQLAGSPRELPPELKAPRSHDPATIHFEDFSQVPFPPGNASGGASVLTAQSQCPFKAFATARLGAKGWEPAEAGLTAAQRGQLLHAVLHAVWAGPPLGIRSRRDLLSLANRETFVAGHVARALREEIPASLRERMPRRYLQLEQQRLIRLVTAWLEFEATRIEFEIASTEAGSTVTIAGLTLNLRLDRIDRLNDNSLLVIDYKSGNVWPKAWDLPRPDDVQLPLYAGFALDRETEVVGGLVFAKVRPGNLAFAGYVGDAKATLLPNLAPTGNLAKNPFTGEQLEDWRDCIQQLARDFVAGRAEVNPREYPKTCERCGLQSLCRIHENPVTLDSDDEAEDAEAADE